MKLRVPIITLVILALATAVAAEQPDGMTAAASKVREYSESGIRIDDVSVESGMLRVHGNANENSDVARFMRYLDTHIGTPSLEYVKRKGDTSEFVLTVRRLK